MHSEAQLHYPTSTGPGFLQNLALATTSVEKYGWKKGAELKKYPYHQCFYIGKSKI